MGNKDTSLSMNLDLHTRIAHVIAPLRGHKGLALDLIWHVSNFAEFIEEEQDARRIHYFYACAELAEAEKLSETKRREFAQAVKYERRIDVLNRFAGQNYPENTLQWLYKLHSPNPLGIRQYYLLLDASKNQLALEALDNAPEIYFNAFYLWHSLPKEFKSTKLLSMLLANPESLRNVWKLINGLLPAPSDEELAMLGQALSSATTLFQLKTRCQIWRERFKELDRFPSPPIPETDNLVPFVDARSLRQVWPSLRLAGLKESVEAVASGEMYLYRWKDEKPAVVWLERGVDQKWAYAYAFYGEDGLVKYETRQRIEEIVEEQLGRTSWVTGGF